MSKGHPKEKTGHDFYIDKLSLYGILLYFIKKGLLKCGLCLQGGLFSEVALNAGLIEIHIMNDLLDYPIIKHNNYMQYNKGKHIFMPPI